MREQDRRHLETVLQILKCERPPINLGDGALLGFNMSVGVDETGRDVAHENKLNKVCVLDKPCPSVGCIAGHLIVLEAMDRDEILPTTIGYVEIDDLIEEMSEEDSSLNAVFRELFYADNAKRTLQGLTVPDTILALEKVLNGEREIMKIWNHVPAMDDEDDEEEE